jgi:hypothetical protein
MTVLSESTKGLCHSGISGFFAAGMKVVALIVGTICTELVMGITWLCSLLAQR